MYPNKALLIALLNACNTLSLSFGDRSYYVLVGLQIHLSYDNNSTSGIIWHAGNYKTLYNAFLNAKKDVIFWNPVTQYFCNL